jgi:phage tail protein X
MAAVAVPAGTRAGLGLGYKTLMLDAVYGETAVTGACGIRVGRGVSLGLAAKYLSLRYGTDAYTRQDPLLAAQAGVAAFDADAGVLWALTPAVTVAYARQNILGADIGLRERVQLTPCDRVALAYRESAFLISAEYVQTSRRTRYLAGMEKMFAHDLFGVRFGAGWGDREFRAIAAGLRANFRQFSVDYAFDIPAGGIDGTSGTHFVTLVARWSRPMTRAEKTSAPAAVVTQLPGMTAPEAAAVAASAAPLCSVPELLPPPTACLRTPLAASLNFELAQSSTVARIGAILEASTATVAAEPPRRMKKAAPAKRAAVTEPAASSAAVPSIVPAMASRPAGPARTCRVAAGDTLPGLAERYYGTKAAWPKIYQANKDRIEKGSLAPGEVLIIP